VTDRAGAIAPPALLSRRPSLTTAGLSRWIIMHKFMLLAAGLAAGTATPALACSSCGCNLPSDWLSQGLVAQAGTTFTLRYDDVPQTQLRHGRGVVDRGAIALPSDDEIEQYTYNHYVTATLDHQFAGAWGIDVQLPYVFRPHATIAEDTVVRSYSRTSGIGDMRIMGRWQHSGGPDITGLQFGLKLPTGAYDQTFRSGPVAGETVDRGLQPGTGTTDAILGAYHFGNLAHDFAYILQAQGQVALNHRDGYRPGDSVTVSAGLHYEHWQGVTPQLQLNFRAAAKDSGVASDRPNSGGEQLYLSPGLTAAITRHVSAFGYLQLPLYQRVSGNQLAPRYTLSVGLSYRL
jgi:hypothetical protein